MDNCKIRLRYSKTGRAKFISHLDLMSTMRRALLRAGVALKYSQGFNPHPVMSIALPLSVGFESVCELIDFESTAELDAAALPGTLNRFLPEGLEILDAYAPQRKFSAISWIEFGAGFVYDAGAPPNIAEQLTQVYRAGSIIISKKTKRGESELDIVPFIRDVEFFDADGITLRVKLFAQNPSISPANLISALPCNLAPDFMTVKRLQVFDADMEIFR